MYTVRKAYKCTYIFQSTNVRLKLLLNSTDEILYKTSYNTCSNLWDLGILLRNLDYNLKLNVFVSIQINGQKTCEFEMHEVF